MHQDSLGGFLATLAWHGHLPVCPSCAKFVADVLDAQRTGRYPVVGPRRRSTSQDVPDKPKAPLPEWQQNRPLPVPPPEVLRLVRFRGRVRRVKPARRLASASRTVPAPVVEAPSPTPRLDDVRAWVSELPAHEPIEPIGDEPDLVRERQPFTPRPRVVFPRPDWGTDKETT